MTNKYTTKDFKEYIANSEGNDYQLLEDYINAKTPIRIRHNVCGTVYSVRPDDFKRGKRCKPCSIIKRSKSRGKTTEEFKEQVYSLVSDEYEVLSEYKNWKTKVKIYHSKCGITYDVQPNSFLQGRRCPNCKYSIGENLIKDYLETHNIEYERQVKYKGLVDKRHLSYDFYLKNYNLLIEYQGRQHYKSVKRYGGDKHLHVQQKHDEMKRNYAKENGIGLLEIKYTYNNSEKIGKLLDEELTVLRKAENLTPKSEIKI